MEERLGLLEPLPEGTRYVRLLSKLSPTKVWHRPTQLSVCSPAGRISLWRLCASGLIGILIILGLIKYLSAPLWSDFALLDGYYNGIRTLVSPAEHVPENKSDKTDLREPSVNPSGEQSFGPVIFDPYTAYAASQYQQTHHKIVPCYIDTQERHLPPDVHAYPAIPQHMPSPLFGSYELLGLRSDVCFDRFGRLAAYGQGLSAHSGRSNARRTDGGLLKSSMHSKELEYSEVDWGLAQSTCKTKNDLRFDPTFSATTNLQRVQRHAYVLRVWQGYDFSEHQMYSLRAMITELSLKTGAEYDVVFLMHVKDTTLPVFTDQSQYDEFVQTNMPREFWNMTVLWSVDTMEQYYPGPFGDAFENNSQSDLYDVQRSAHMPLQWFAQSYPDYDFYWNWEMDIRNIGHYYEFNTRLGDWARHQPRKGLWERNERFYIPRYHGSWSDFTTLVERETRDRGREPVWGPVEFNNNRAIPHPGGTEPPSSYERDNYQWGVGEEADLITLTPIFVPNNTEWAFGKDIAGYDMSRPMRPPPRRAAIVTAGRLSKRLLDTMHAELRDAHHTAWPEMWPATVALHHGLKAVHAPHPLYFDRDWDPAAADAVFNADPTSIARGRAASPYAYNQHNFQGASFYYDTLFAGPLWRRWLGLSEMGVGGREHEDAGSGRMCLRSTIVHPVKHEEESLERSGVQRSG